MAASAGRARLVVLASACSLLSHHWRFDPGEIARFNRNTADYSKVGRTSVTRTCRARVGRIDVLCCRERTFRCVRSGSRRKCRHANPSPIGPEFRMADMPIRQSTFGIAWPRPPASSPVTGLRGCRRTVESPPVRLRACRSSPMPSRVRRIDTPRCRRLGEASGCRTCAATSARTST